MDNKNLKNIAVTDFVCVSNTNKKSLLSKTQKNARNKNTIAIGEK